MYSERIDVEAEVELLAPLHIGDGDLVAEEDRGTARRDERGAAEVARVLLHANGHPCLPASTVKGMLNAALRNAGREDAADRLFGTIGNVGADADGNPTATGSIGRVLARAAPLIPDTIPGAMLDKLPHARKTAAGGHQGLYIRSATAIDRRWGAADAGKLFHQEMVPKGCRFRLRFTLLASEKGDLEVFREALGALAAEASPGLGKGHRHGNGRLRLVDGSARMRRADLDSLGAASVLAWEDLAVASAPSLPRGRRWRLKLRCDGPYLSMDSDPAHTPKARGGDEAARRQSLQAAALRQGDRAPILPPSSLLGALRARCTWLMMLEDGCTGPSTGVDDRFVRRKLVAALTPIERLFGVTGWRGLLCLDALELENEPRPIRLTSVALDQFSGAVIDNALFTTEAFLAPTFTATLRLEPRGDGAVLAACESRLNGLFADLSEEGLMLGHGGAKGFGWFTVSVEELDGEEGDGSK